MSLSQLPVCLSYQIFVCLIFCLCLPASLSVSISESLSVSRPRTPPPPPPNFISVITRLPSLSILTANDEVGLHRFFLSYLCSDPHSQLSLLFVSSVYFPLLFIPVSAETQCAVLRRVTQQGRSLEFPCKIFRCKKLYETFSFTFLNS